MECGDAGEDEIDPGEELFAVVVVTRPGGDGPGERTVGQRPERQSVLACRVEQFDGRLDDAIERERFRAL